MAETTADVSFGVILKKGGAAIGDTYTDFGLEITNLTPPGWTREDQDATHHQSPNGWAESIMSAIKRQTPFPIELNWVPANTGAIKTAFEAAAKVYWEIEFPDGSSVKVKAGMTEFTPGDMTTEGKMTASATFSPTGEPTWA